MKTKDFSAIIMAAGKGTRMKSPLPKVVHPVAGTPIIYRVVKEAFAAGANEVRVVVGHGAELVKQIVTPLGATCFVQQNQKGTADAVRSAEPESIAGPVIIFNGDHPLITRNDIRGFMENYFNGQGRFSLVTVDLEEPGTYGRIVRQSGDVKAIVEAKDAAPDTLKIKEVNTGIYILDADILREQLPKIQNNNAQGEFYFTDIVSLCLSEGERIETVKAPEHVSQGVNDQKQLAQASTEIFQRNRERLLTQGVVLIDPATTYIEDEVEVGEATVIYPGCYLGGKTKIGSYCVLEPNCFLSNANVGSSVQVKAGSYLESCLIKDRAAIGPYARIRPNSEIGEEAKVGNFVELKNVKFGDRAKASHLTYLGDAEIGEGTNIGCGTITCNYAADKKKYVTKIGKNVFVGSDTQFVAPVEVGDNSFVGSGSTITKNIPAGALGVARGRQTNIENFQPKNKTEGQVK